MNQPVELMKQFSAIFYVRKRKKRRRKKRDREREKKKKKKKRQLSLPAIKQKHTPALQHLLSMSVRPLTQKSTAGASA